MFATVVVVLIAGAFFLERAGYSLFSGSHKLQGQVMTLCSARIKPNCSLSTDTATFPCTAGNSCQPNFFTIFFGSCSCKANAVSTASSSSSRSSARSSTGSLIVASSSSLNPNGYTCPPPSSAASFGATNSNCHVGGTCDPVNCWYPTYNTGKCEQPTLPSLCIFYPNATHPLHVDCATPETSCKWTRCKDNSLTTCSCQARGCSTGYTPHGVYDTKQACLDASTPANCAAL
ncbi:MAG: hypothetical protein Greene041662_840 [Candidatus Peregrinibacteria bacterium Greene0416_62]|nr:MAG: hypothetical protein Greene041662_840 [Candidatus Peregrinibacteria bacterium Greene0416_62]TSC98019.1 MAG: hypothetical protein Greene101449_1041 [Candidatus Peregrinibacteria bacterium Greene1014_49]